MESLLLELKVFAKARTGFVSVKAKGQGRPVLTMKVEGRGDEKATTEGDKAKRSLNGASFLACA